MQEVHIGTIIMGLSIMHFWGSRLKIPESWFISVTEGLFLNLANSAELDEIHLGLHCLQ